MSTAKSLNTFKYLLEFHLVRQYIYQDTKEIGFDSKIGLEIKAVAAAPSGVGWSTTQNNYICDSQIIVLSFYIIFVFKSPSHLTLANNCLYRQMTY